MKAPILIVNLKIYEQGIGLNTLRFCEYASSLKKKYDVATYIAVNPIDIRLCLDKYRDVIISQTADVVGYGAKTGHISINVLSDIGVKGTLVNHSEYKINHNVVKDIVDVANDLGLLTFVCVDSIKELKELLNLDVKPTAFAIEPPELIGTGKSVSKYQPETVINAVKIGEKYGVDILCGAGVTNSDDVEMALKLGVTGVLVASGVVKASSPYQVMENMVKVMTRNGGPAGI